jgi:hypothetical protein
MAANTCLDWNAVWPPCATLASMARRAGLYSLRHTSNKRGGITIMIRHLALAGLVAISNTAWAAESEPPKNADLSAPESTSAEQAPAENGVVTRSTTITGGATSTDKRSAIIQDSSRTILVIGQTGVEEIPYGTTKQALEKIAKARSLPMKKLSDSEWVLGVNGAHIMFRNGKVAGEKLNLGF